MKRRDAVIRKHCKRPSTVRGLDFATATDPLASDALSVAIIIDGKDIITICNIRCETPFT